MCRLAADNVMVSAVSAATVAPPSQMIVCVCYIMVVHLHVAGIIIPTWSRSGEIWERWQNEKPQPKPQAGWHWCSNICKVTTFECKWWSGCHDYRNSILSTRRHEFEYVGSRSYGADASLWRDGCQRISREMSILTQLIHATFKNVGRTSRNSRPALMSNANGDGGRGGGRGLPNWTQPKPFQQVAVTSTH